jgi:hypothetical protein
LAQAHRAVPTKRRLPSPRDAHQTITDRFFFAAEPTFDVTL